MLNKKELKNKFDELTKDVLDNYDKYSMDHKIMVKNQLIKFEKLNEYLSIYDNKKQKDDIKKEFDKLRDELINRFDSYIESDKDKIRKELSDYESLNNVLEQYDDDVKIVEKKKGFFEYLFQAFGIKK